MKYSPEMYIQKLNEVFERHDPGNKYLSERIANDFPDSQREVFDHLTAIYADRDGTLEDAMNKEIILTIPPKANTGVG